MYVFARLANLTREVMRKIGEALNISPTLDLHANLDRAGTGLKASPKLIYNLILLQHPPP